MKKRMIALLLACLCLTGCGGQSLTSSRTAAPPGLDVIPEAEADALADFSLRLLGACWEDNVLLSPLSLLSALGMTANGARGETLAQMEAVLGLPLAALNRDLSAWPGSLEGEGLHGANALWIRDDGSFTAEEAFLTAAGEQYGAEVFTGKMDRKTLQEINRWVKRNTGGMIDGILTEIPPDAVMYLVNALALEAEWETVYRKDLIHSGTFTTEAGEEQPAEMMYSTESRYLEDGRTTGFLKPYKGGRFAFAALLPGEGESLEACAASLTGEGLRALLSGAQNVPVDAGIPKFQQTHSAELSEALEALGMTDAFGPAADLSGLGTSEEGPLYISKVLHKTFLTIDEKGTRAGAASAVEASSGSSGPQCSVILDRPFLYLLVDLETSLPLFLGTVASL